ncbi:Ger(x)C family spore germination protein [Gottfriedia luciferensis]|uniref:Ger(x)C family spore germination protein n=1 Tax=Gottfriedia luciferensis TaxID=178774 RepID=UPI000B4552A4|nr:Ger(x)C family spore germination protein [Gottfriedia luciferensis]
MTIKKYIVSFMILTVILSGCSNYKELNQISIVLAMGVDYLPKEKKYEMILQILNPSSIATQSGSQGVPIISLEDKGKTISEAARNVTKKGSRTNIYSHIALVVIGETLAREKSLNYIFDVFERDSKIRVNIPVVIARNKNVDKVMNNLATLDKLSAKSIVGKINNTSALLGENQKTLIRHAISAISSSGREPIINGASLKNESESSETLEDWGKVNSSFDMINGTGIFRNAKLVGWLDGPPAKSIQVVDNLIKETNLEIPCNKKEYDSMELTRVKSKTEIKMKGNIPIITIKINSIGHIDEVLCNDNFDKAASLKKYEISAENVLKQSVEKGITEVKKLGGDAFGFGEKLYTANPKVYKKYEKNWNDTFKKAKVTVSVDVKINDVGMRKKAYPY